MLGIERASGHVTLSVKREAFGLTNVTWRIADGNIVAISIGTFIRPDTGRMFEAAIKAGQDQLHGAENVNGYAVDLRDNGGGLVDQAHDVLDTMIDGEKFDRSYGAKVSDEILRRNTLVVTQGHHGHDERLTAKPGALMNGKPIAIIINGDSASASEIVAGAAQDFGAIIVGQDSFGKATFQAVMPLPAAVADPPVETNIGQFKVTGGRYVYGPQGHSPQWTGVHPNVVVNFMEAAKERESSLPHALPPPEGAPPNTQAQRSCDKTGDAPKTDNGLIDPRTGEYDSALACAVLALRAQKEGLGVRLSGAAKPPAP